MVQYYRYCNFIPEGETDMPMRQFPQEIKKFEVQAYERPKSLKALKKNHVPFSGSPRKHPHDREKVILVVDPYSSNTFYYEFKAKDISFVEELPGIINLDGEILPMVRIWVKKTSVGLRCSPFIVEDIEM